MKKELEIAWAAGLFEGEGSIVFDAKQKNPLSLKMTDKDVMERFIDVVGYGNLTGPYMYKKSSNKTPYWAWQVYKRTEILRVLKIFLPYLGKRRSKRANDVINHLNEIIN